MGIPAGGEGVHRNVGVGMLERWSVKLPVAAALHYSITPRGLHIGIARAQHLNKAVGFFFAPAAFTRFFKMPMVAHNAQSAFTVDFLFQPPQGFFDRLAFFQFYLSQSFFTSSPATASMAWQGRQEA